METKRKRTFYEVVVKRPADFICALLAIIVLSPLIFFVAFLVRVKHGKGVIFKQKRVGLGRKVFWFYKFRSMSNKRDANGELLPDRDRVTKFGKFIRKTSLDELPQLFNILKGNMSFIGPRPRDVRECVFLDEEKCKRFLVRPGVSGLAQVNGRNSIGFDRVVEYDTKYVSKVTWWRDVKIFFKTFFVVFKRRGIESQVEAKNLGEYYGDTLLRREEISQEEYDERVEFSKTLNVKDIMPSSDEQKAG